MSNEAELKDFLRKETASTRRGANILLVGGIVVVVVIAGYFGYILNYLQRKWEAKGFVEIALNQATKALEQGRPQLEKWVIDQLPGFMDTAETQLIKYMPEGRRRAEDLIAQAADKLAAEVHERASEQIEQIMLTHGSQIRAALEASGDIQKSEDAKENLKAALEEEFEKVAVQDLDPRVDEYLKALEDMNTELGVLVESPVSKLTQEQRLERELIQIVYTLIERNYARLRGLGTVPAAPAEAN